jgi:hypothetical protein
MIAFFLRLLSAVSLAVAVVIAVLDGARSIADRALALTPLGEALAEMLPMAGEGGASSLPRWAAALVDPLITALLTLPAAAAFAGAALALYILAGVLAPQRNRYLAQR